MYKYADLKNECIAIGSLPHKNLDEAISMIKQYNYNIPFCPQMVKFSKNEDMLFQYLENIPDVRFDFASDKIFVNDNSKDFLNYFDEVFLDFEDIKNYINSEKLDKYSISKDFSVAFNTFYDFVKSSKPKYAKTQVTGPFTLSVNIYDSNNQKFCYDKSKVDFLTKLICLKALWQIREIKKSSSNTVPIIFIDEPTLSQLDNEEYKCLSRSEIVDNIKKISDLIKSNGGISAIHCCGNCNWSETLRIGLDIINFDAYTYGDEMNLYINDLEYFLENGGKIAWGIVPTLDKKALELATLKDLKAKFDEVKNTLIQKGLKKELVENNSLISSSCGCATLSVELTEKTFKLTKDLSESLKR